MVYANARQEETLALQWLRQRSEKMAVVYVMNPNTELLVTNLDDQLRLQKHSFDMKETDFKTIILKLKDGGVDGVIVLGYTNQITSFVQQTIELGYHPHFIFSTSDGARKEVIQEIYLPLRENNITYVTVGYGYENQDYLFGYDLMKLLIEAMKQCEENTACLKQELKTIKIQGKSGVVDMAGKNVATVSPKLYIIERGALRLIE